MSRLRAISVLALACGLALGGPSAAQTPDADRESERTSRARMDVRVKGRAGSETLHVVATEARLDALVRRVARDSNRTVTGLETLGRNPLVTAKLAGEDLRDGLRFIGGSVGLRIVVKASEIVVDEDLPPYPTRNDLYDRAGALYLRALIDHPDSDLAPSAAWNRARVEQATPGRELEAARAFDKIGADYPGSDLVPEALLQAGIMFGKANAWEDAASRFDTLAGSKTPHDYSATARRLLADAHTRVADAATNPLVREENARRALLVLDALDDIEPTQNPAERRRRYLVRSRAHSLAGNAVEALRSLDLAAQYSDRRIADPEIAELRARALERAGHMKDAVRAWLKYGRLVEGDARVDAFQRAARVANEGRENLTAIAIARAAENEGFGDALAPYADDALAALDLDATRLDLFGDTERVRRAERLMAKGLEGEAIEALRPVFDRRLSLDRDQRLRLGMSYARALVAEERLDEALVVLRTTASEQDVAASRREVYLLAADLLESAGEFERAIDALEGRL